MTAAHSEPIPFTDDLPILRATDPMLKNRAVLVAVLSVATVAVGGAAWLATQSAEPIGTGKTVHVLAVPT